MANHGKTAAAVIFTILDIIFICLFQFCVPLANSYLQDYVDEGAGRKQQICVFIFGCLFITTPSIISMIFM